MSLQDAEEWAEAYNQEYTGIKQRGDLETVRIEKGIKLMGMPTRTEYKVSNGEFSRHKVRLCTMGNQQVEDLQYDACDLYALAAELAEACVLAAIMIAAQDGYNKSLPLKWR